MALLNALGNLHSSFPVPTDPNPLLCQGMASAVPQLPPRTESGHALRGTGHSPVPECRGTSQKVILAGGQEPDDREARALPLRLCTSFIGPAPRCRGRECWQSRGQASTDPAGPGYHRSSPDFSPDAQQHPCVCLACRAGSAGTASVPPAGTGDSSCHQEAQLCSAECGSCSEQGMGLFAGSFVANATFPSTKKG